jgi:hypothetical protein
VELPDRQQALTAPVAAPGRFWSGSSAGATHRFDATLLAGIAIGYAHNKHGTNGMRRSRGGNPP